MYDNHCKPGTRLNPVLGVIEGSEESLSHQRHFLDKKAYENLSHRAQYAFANRRETIYAIFQLYLKQKKANNEYDAADRCVMPIITLFLFLKI